MRPRGEGVRELPGRAGAQAEDLAPRDGHPSGVEDLTGDLAGSRPERPAPEAREPPARRGGVVRRRTTGVVDPEPGDAGGGEHAHHGGEVIGRRAAVLAPVPAHDDRRRAGREQLDDLVRGHLTDARGEADDRAPRLPPGRSGVLDADELELQPDRLARHPVQDPVQRVTHARASPYPD